MRAFADELVSVPAATVVTLTADTYAPTGVSKATRATVTNVTVSNGDCTYRFLEDPVDTPRQGHYLVTGQSVTLESFDDIVNFKALLTGGSTASLFITYFQ